jgi:hypothetical protein
MKLVVYSSQTRGFDSRIFVVKTVNKPPQAKRLLVLEQSLDLASVNQGLQDVITRQVPAHKLHALLANSKRLVREKLSLTLPVGLLAFHFASLTLLLFWILSRSFWKLRQGSSDGSLDRSSGICCLTKGFKWASTSYFYGLYVDLWVG